MKIVLGADKDGFSLKEHIKNHLIELDYEIIDKSPENTMDFVEAATSVSKAVIEGEGRGIMIDQYGAGSFMVANKHKGMICAQVSDEHSAKMTRDHNNTSAIAIGAGIVGEKLAERIVEVFAQSEYSGGRHQIRVDMLNKMC